jgi:hypothetical protein
MQATKAEPVPCLALPAQQQAVESQYRDNRHAQLTEKHTDLQVRYVCLPHVPQLLSGPHQAHPQACTPWVQHQQTWGP